MIGTRVLSDDDRITYTFIGKAQISYYIYLLLECSNSYNINGTKYIVELLIKYWNNLDRRNTLSLILKDTFSNCDQIIAAIYAMMNENHVIFSIENYTQMRKISYIDGWSSIGDGSIDAHILNAIEHDYIQISSNNVLTAKIEPEIGLEIEPEIGPEIEPEIGPEIGPEIEPEIEISDDEIEHEPEIWDDEIEISDDEIEIDYLNSEHTIQPTQTIKNETILLQTQQSSLVEIHNSDLQSYLQAAVDEIQEKLEIRPPIMVFGKECNQNRDVGFFSNESAGYNYSNQKAPSKLLTPTLTLMLNAINLQLGSSYNGILVNRYTSGTDVVGAHSDSERSLDPIHGVVCISWGQVRNFRIRSKVTKNIILNVDLQSGQIIAMRGKFQKEFTHEIPQEKRRNGVRYSFTFRKHLY